MCKTCRKHNLMPVADQQFHDTAMQRNEDRKRGLTVVKKVFSAKMPQFGKYKL